MLTLASALWYVVLGIALIALIIVWVVVRKKQSQ